MEIKTKKCSYLQWKKRKIFKMFLKLLIVTFLVIFIEVLLFKIGDINNMARIFIFYFVFAALYIKYILDTKDYYCTWKEYERWNRKEK